MDTLFLTERYDLLCRKAAQNARWIGADMREFPACTDGRYFAASRSSLRPTSHIFCWTQSFFTGMALLAAEHTGEWGLVKWCNQFYEEYRKKVFDTPQNTMHDLGFLYTLYSTMSWKLTADHEMKELSLKAAEVLAHRFVPNGGYIRAWGRMDDTIPKGIDDRLAKDNFFANSQGLAIVDCMMNLPLLFWAGKETADPFFTNVAVCHADTTLKHFIRQDGSVCHAFRFDAETGAPLNEFNDCGYAVGSHWARGAAWAVYGFALAYRYTGFRRYRDAVLKISQAYLDACGQSVIPPWDFRLPANQPARYGGRERQWTAWDIAKKENCIYNVDTSAAAIISCGFLEFCELEPNQPMKAYADSAVQLLLKEYCNYDMDIAGILSKTNGTDTYGCFGDYFMMELVARYLKKESIAW